MSKDSLAQMHSICSPSGFRPRNCKLSTRVDGFHSFVNDVISVDSKGQHRDDLDVGAGGQED